METEKLKVVLIGDGAVGKTTILMVFILGDYPELYVPTVFDQTDLEYFFEDRKILLRLFDTGGGIDYPLVRPLCYTETDCFLLCYSVVGLDSVMNLERTWFPEIRNNGFGDVPVVLCGTKKDLVSDNSDGYISIKMVKRIVKNKYPIVEISALEEAHRTGDREGSLSAVFNTCIRQALIHSSSSSELKPVRDKCSIL